MNSMYPMPCSMCQELKNRNEFVRCSTVKRGHKLYCKVCHASRMKTYDRSEVYVEKRKPWNRHHISEEYYIELLNKFDGQCWICQASQATVVDHDHNCCPQTYSCGACVRGMLCSSCNTALGLFKDNKDTLTNALNYLQL